MFPLNAFVAIALLAATGAFAQTEYVGRIRIPDISGYRTLKCDFHVHTVFSDGDVWPTFRVQEAAAEGLDAIALTDHLEYQPKAEYVSKDRNAPHMLARKEAAEAGLILIPGAEITRSMPPGHLNALFVQDANALIKDDWKDAIAEAARQGAIILWNHPGWEGQQPDGRARWYDEHSFLFSRGYIAGMEIVNYRDYYPEVFDWCREKQIAVVGNSDTHQPIDFEFGTKPDRLRPITLVFARERTAASIKEAILQRRTAVLRGWTLYGEDRWLQQIFEQSVAFGATSITMTGRERVRIQLTNTSDISYTLALAGEDSILQFPRKVELMPGKTALFSIRPRSNKLSWAQPITAHYRVTNLLVAPGKALTVPLTFDVVVKPGN